MIVTSNRVEGVITHLREGERDGIMSTQNLLGTNVCKNTCLLTWTVRVGLFCLKSVSHTSRVPSIPAVKNTPGLVGLQQQSVRGVPLYLVHMIGDSFVSSDHNCSYKGESEMSMLKVYVGISISHELLPLLSSHQQRGSTWDRMDFASDGKEKGSKATLILK